MKYYHSYCPISNSSSYIFLYQDPYQTHMSSLNFITATNICIYVWVCGHPLEYKKKKKHQPVALRMILSPLTSIYCQ